MRLATHRLAPGLLLTALLSFVPTSRADFDPQIGQAGSLGIAQSSNLFKGWATNVVSIDRGPMNAANLGLGDATSGSFPGLISLGDGGSITLKFDNPLYDGAGADFAVFENGFLSGGPGLAFLELAFVEVSTDGVNFFRFDATSLTQTTTQVGGFGLLDASKINNLAGKYISGYGTGFDLSELSGRSPLLDVNNINYVRIIDVVGSIDPAYGSYDAFGHLINDPFSTPFASSGFDLSAVGVINVASVPEPASLATAGIGFAIMAAVIRARRRRTA